MLKGKSLDLDAHTISGTLEKARTRRLHKRQYVDFGF